MLKAYLAPFGLMLFLASCEHGVLQPDFVSRIAIPKISILAQKASEADDSWRKQIIYFALLDRFFNGNALNDAAGQPYCFDQASPYKFHGGDLTGLRSKISYIKFIGATAVWTSPVYAQVPELHSDRDDATCGYHGYWPNFTNPFDITIEPKLGTSADLVSLTAELHNNGMKYIMDMVVNHAGYGASVVKTNPEWFHGDCVDDEINCPLAGLPDFRQEDRVVANYLTNLSKSWIAAYEIDGIRMDTAKHVPMHYWQHDWIPGVRSLRPRLFLLAEAFLTSGAYQLKPYYDAGFSSVFNFPLRDALVSSIAKGGNMSMLASGVQDYLETLGLRRALLTVNLLDNHDVPRFLNEPGNGVDEDEIRRRYHMALGALFTLPGIPQLYYGNEIGMYGGADPDNRRDMPAWAWTSAGRAGTYSGFLPNPGLTFNLVTKLSSVRTSNPALWKGIYAELWRPFGGANAFAFYRGYHDEKVKNSLIVVLNNSENSAEVTLDINANTSISSVIRSYLANRVFDDQAGQGAPSVVASYNGNLTASLPAKSFAIYKAR